MNYIQLINWFWEDVPYRQGYKSEYGILFMAIVDSINRNGWKSTRIEYDRIINKTQIGKKSYLDGRKWLRDEKLIDFVPGKNYDFPAQFTLTDQLKAEAQKSTSDVPLLLLSSSSDVPLSLPCDTSAIPIIDKHLNYKTTKPLNTPTNQSRVPLVDEEERKSLVVKSQKEEKAPPAPAPPPVAKPSGRDPFLRNRDAEDCNVPFSAWFAAFGYNANQEQSKAAWLDLTDDERQTAMQHTPAFVESRPEKQFRGFPNNYLTEKKFNNEIVPRRESDNTQSGRNAATGDANKSGRTDAGNVKQFGEWRGNRFAAPQRAGSPDFRATQTRREPAKDYGKL
ncbi:hypothetical protein [uncultured Fibrella sp.]|uniref:hypothetical protein n=1 Tax=uncultured Fibrella sp. TaxID=1284596 RepID=UPI0035CADECC